MNMEPAGNPPDDSGPPEFNQIELEVLRLIPTSLTYAGIGGTVCRSVRTVEGIVANLFDKTGTNRRHLLALWAIRHGCAGEATA